MTIASLIEPAATAFLSSQVSTRSSFADDVWHLDAPIAHVRKDAATINWNVPLRDGSNLTDPRHARCLFSCKMFIVLLSEGKAHSGLPHRGGSLIRKYEAIRALLSWLPAKPTVTLSDLTEARLASYCASLKKRRARVRSKGGNYVPHARQLSPRSVRQMLQIAIDLAHMGPLLPDRPTLTVFEAQRLVYASAPSSHGSTPRIPDAHFEAIMQCAIRWLSEVAPLVLARDAETLQIKRAHAATGGSNLAHHYRKYYERNRETTIVRVGGSDHDISIVKRIQLISWLNFTQTACFIIIAGCTGMRASEILSLRKGCLSSKAIAEQPHRLLQLDGTLFKTVASTEGEPAAWIAGWDDGENPVRAAVHVLESIHARYPEDGGETLFAPIREKRLSDTGGRSGHSITGQVNRFAEFNGVHGWRFASHQFRKTFARFVSIKSPTAVLALQRHFKHVSVAMTERYLSYDDALLDEIIEQSFDLDLETLDRVLAADSLGGLKGEAIILRNQAFRGSAGAEQRRAYIESIRNDPLFLMLRHEYGVCFYDAQQAACGGRRVKIGLETCVDCRNFVTGEEHTPYWRERVRAFSGDRRELRALGQTSSILEQQLQSARKVLHAIDKDTD
jgi:integrase